MKEGLSICSISSWHHIQ